MRFRLVVDGESRLIEVERSAQGIRVQVDGAEYRGRARRLEDGVAVRIGSTWHRIRFEGRTAIFYDGLHHIGIADIESESVEPTSAAGPRGARFLKIRAPMAGRVVRILVQPGDRVVRGQALLVLEAMKMQNEIAAPRAGSVKQVDVVEGESVIVDRVVAVLERG